ncbi:restriction endonuclease subunit S [Micrococcus sp. HOU01]|uniref:restriction endonuclease subunit S n=1 Tax=Micrococcus sp. HOU01 TaxID=3101753 RepID=UPI002D77619C|nr:restriction endonuclease subunit S [Micrococcus sp. HOU1]WRQ42732.1 restriction endonuclease subunit S [Micrococcus sp. HOU1]
MNLNLDKSHWKRVAFGDVVRNVNETVRDLKAVGIDRIIAMEHVDPGELNVSRWGSTEDDTTFTRRVKPGQTLFGKRRAYQRKVAYAEFDAICSGDIYTFEAAETQLLGKLLPFLVQSNGFFEHALGTSAGSLSPRTNWRNLKEFEFDLPPLDEQKRIADLLWAVERHRLQLATSVRSVMEAVDVYLRALWESETGKRAIGDVADCVTGSTPSKSNEAYWNSSDVPFYTPSEIDGETMGAPRQWVSQAGASAGRLLPEFAVAVACIGGDMGKSTVIREPGISNQQITSIVGLASEDAYLMQSLLAHPLGRLALEARETTTIVRKLNKSDLMKVEVPWPEDRLFISQLVRRRRETVTAITQEALSLRVLVSALLAEIFGD